MQDRITDGIGLTVAMQSMNMLDQLASVEEMGPVGEIRLMPDPSTFRVLPYAPHSAAMTVDMCTLEEQPWGACPRSFLKRQVQDAVFFFIDPPTTEIYTLSLHDALPTSSSVTVT